jgi:hypothetical protein
LTENYVKLWGAQTDAPIPRECEKKRRFIHIAGIIPACHFDGGKSLYHGRKVLFGRNEADSALVITLCINSQNGSHKQQFTVDEQKKE